jgi:hypothetical protein
MIGPEMEPNEDLREVSLVEQAAQMQWEGPEPVMEDIDQILEEMEKKTLMVYGVEVEFTRECFHQEDFFVHVLGYE